MLPLISADWSAPANVRAFVTTVSGGVSQGSYAALNLGQHVGDNPADVRENRKHLQQSLGNAVKLRWLRQTHSDIIADDDNYICDMEADAAVTELHNQACVVMTADCLPVLLCHQQAKRVAALHCGWRGLHKNLIAKVLDNYFAGEQQQVLAWLGPAIGATSYEVDEQLFQRFKKIDPAYGKAFRANRPGHYHFDLGEIAKQQLRQAGILPTAISGGDWDTYSDEQFFSYRRNANCGRMATVIAITADSAKPSTT